MSLGRLGGRNHLCSRSGSGSGSQQGCGVSTQPAAPVAPLLLVEERGGILEILWGVVKLDCEICDGRPELASCLLEASPGVEVSATTRDMRCG